MTAPQPEVIRPIPLTEYQYAELSDPRHQIRLLRLHPGEGDDPVSCTVSVCDRDKAPDYHALSYTWGSREDPATIVVGGTSVFVNQNCQYALWQARFLGAKLVWIDSVCINQRDLQEKGVQVSIMFEIFHGAAQVLLCVGPAFDGIELVQQAAAEQEVRDVRSRNNDWDEVWLESKGEAYATSLAHAFDTLCLRPYFYRLWVAQEIFAARNTGIVACGELTVPWTSLADLDLEIRIWTGEYASSIHTLDELCKSREMPSKFGTTYFLHRLDWTRDLLCEDPRDRIYGTLKLFNWTAIGVLAPEPDYNKFAIDLALDLAERVSPSDVDLLKVLTEALRIRSLDFNGYDWSHSAASVHSNGRDEPRRWDSWTSPICVLYRDNTARLVCRFFTSAIWEDVGRPLVTSPASVQAQTSGGQDKGLSPAKGPATELFTEHGSLVGLACSSATDGDIIVTEYFGAGEIVLRCLPTRDGYQVVGRAAMRIQDRVVSDFHGATLQPSGISEDTRLKMTATYRELVYMYADRSDLSYHERLDVHVPRVGSCIRDKAAGSTPRLIEFVERYFKDSMLEESAAGADEDQNRSEQPEQRPPEVTVDDSSPR